MDVVAILAADLHLSLKPPVARSVESDWLNAQRRPLEQIQVLIDIHHCPLLVAGDLFDRWNAPAELINWALKWLPDCHAIAGNHDLPNHDLKSMRRSAYGVLVQAGKVTNVPPGKPVEIDRGHPIRLHGFPCGVPVRPLAEPHDLLIEVALVHEYLWVKGTGHVGARPEQRLKARRKQFAGYDAAVVGDNHVPFDVNGPPWIMNCGAVQRRRADEIDFKPSVGLLMSDGTVKRHWLDCHKDKFVTPDELTTVAGGDVSGFVDELGSLADAGLDFEAALRKMVADERLREGVKAKVLEALDSG